MFRKAIDIVKEWALIVSILTGIVAYLVYSRLPLSEEIHHVAASAVAFLQPALIFLMLFFTFCKVNTRDMHLCRWHLWLLLFQGGMFSVLAFVLILLPHSGLRVVLEGAMICFICPTATAAAVITRRLGGNLNHITTYTILINILAALLIPALLPYVHPQPGMGVTAASMLILSKVFPLLLFPLLLALLVRFMLPKVHARLARWQDVPFYLWIVSLALAMAVTTRSLCHSSVDLVAQAGLVAVSLGSCVLQFYLGRRIGRHYSDAIAAGQALGQKNTVLAIWLGYTFFTPVTSIAGGFYSIWHNVVNSWQLHKVHSRCSEGS